MLTDLIISLFAGKAAESLNHDQIRRQALIGTIAGGLILAVSIPALQIILSLMESGKLVEKIPGAVGLIGTAILALGFYTLLRGVAFFLLLKKLS